MPKITVPIKGMHCRSCEILIESGLKKVYGVNKVEVSYKTGQADIYFHKTLPASEAIRQVIKDAGYDVGRKDKLHWFSRDKNDYSNLLSGAVILFVLYLIANRLGLLTLAVNTQSTSLLVVLVVGLVAGISTCMALVGGLVLSLSARHAELHPEISTLEKFRPHLYFNLGRILGFGFLGGLIGLLGAAFKPSSSMLGLMTLIVGGVMILLGLKLIEIFPALKNTSFSLPKGVAKFFGLHKEQKEYSHKSAVITGALTFFLPCGFTQAMQLYAVSSGSFVKGALIMSLFALGTAPGLLGIGGLASIFKGQRARKFFATAGLAVIIFGLFNITNGSQLIFQGKPGIQNAAVGNSDGVQEIKMTQGGSGYSPNEFTVEKGKKVRWIITSTSQFTCASSIVMPKYGITKYLNKGENIIEFIPQEVGVIPFSCSMGMYRGKINVVEPGSNKVLKNSVTAPGSNQLAVAGSGSCGSAGGGCGGCGGGGCGGGVKKNVDANPAATVTDSNNQQIIKAQYTLNNDIVPNRFEVKKGIPVKFEVDVKDNGQGCMSTIMVPELYENPQYLEGGTKIVMEFTPTQEGEFNITCAMGVPRGIIKVIS